MNEEEWRNIERTYKNSRILDLAILESDEEDKKAVMFLS